MLWQILRPEGHAFVFLERPFPLYTSTIIPFFFSPLAMNVVRNTFQLSVLFVCGFPLLNCHKLKCLLTGMSDTHFGFDVIKSCGAPETRKREQRCSLVRSS